MKTKQNLGKLDRIFRFILGIFIFSPWAPHFSYEWLNVAIIILGVDVIIGSITAHCWLHKICGIDNTNQ